MYDLQAKMTELFFSKKFQTFLQVIPEWGWDQNTVGTLGTLLKNDNYDLKQMMI